MARHPTPEFAALNVKVARGHAGYWSVIRTLDDKGPWSVADVAERSKAARQPITDYVRRLVLAGFVEKVGEYPGPVLPLPTYRLARRPLAAPRLRRDGSECPPTRQSQMWNAIRTLGVFTFRELAHAASTDALSIAPSAAQDYVNRLGRAGYLAPVQKSKPGTPTAWRLKPSMNTGPLPPLVMRTKFLWDQNRGEVVGVPEQATEATQ